MADEQAFPQALQWGRLPDGRFFFRVTLPIMLPGMQGQAYAPIHSFIFTKEEEERLKSSLYGLLPASEMPKNNGGQKTPGLHPAKPPKPPKK